MVETLSGLGVLVTRPEGQAEPLCRLIEAAGGRPLRLPGIIVGPARDQAEAMRLLAADWDLLIFVSRNAVEYGLPLCPASRLPASSFVAAVGGATARTLTAIGRKVDLVPKHRYDTEGLLELPELQRMSGSRVLIVRGDGGRPLLADSLRARGARVEYAEVYRREPPCVDIEPWIGRLRDEVRLLSATSTEILQNLCGIFGEQGRPLLVERPLVVVSQRTAATAESLGFKHIRTADRADDQAILKALLRLARERS